MKKTYFILSLSFIIISILTLYKLMFKEQKYYQEKYEDKTTIYIHSISSPRGRILDCNGIVLVDNIAVKTIVYRKEKNISEKEELEIARKLSRLLEWNEKTTTTELKNYWLRTHKEEEKKLITEEEYRLYDERKLTSNDLYYLKIDRITKEMLNNLSEEDKKIAHIYALMNKGYSYEPKIIKKEITEKEYAQVMEENMKGITSELFYKREYPYGNTLKGIFGSVGAIPKEDEEFYINKGYSLDDVVGISYLEKEYEDYLKGEKEVYQVKSDGSLLKIKEGSKGNDLILAIDIRMQQGIEDILKKEIKEGKKLLNTEYYNGSYVVIGDLNGAIKAMVGLKMIKEDVFTHVETDILNTSFTVGSVVKGASMAMAYQNHLVDIGHKIKDACVKLYLVPEKCSYKSLGLIDDITALKTSSNYYQFLLAIKLAGYKYTPNMKMNVSDREFSIYRDAFASFGLGTKTGIDLPNEFTGIKGTTIAPDLLLNFAIGQYDTYTPLQLLQYINTIANNGKRYRLRLLNAVQDPNHQMIYKTEREEMSAFSLEEEYFHRIKEGFYQVVNLGTGYGYVDPKFQAIGKTGTSETYFDSDFDGIGDVLTISNTFAMYAPRDNPKYSMVVVSPNVNNPNKKNDYFAYINRFISKKVSDYVFTNY